MSARFVLLAVGTEVVSGQILNRNAATLSEWIENLGHLPVLHLTVADDRAMILEALHTAKRLGEGIIVCGGLGPTQDDFTRNVIAEFLGEELVFDPGSWAHIEERLGKMGVPIAQANRQQCYFPRSARVIPNPQGSANAFSCDTIWVLPGPPREIEAVWPEVARQIQERFPTSQSLELHTWQCLGMSEAAVGEKVEAALQGSGLQTGYRLHGPYVEVKIWVPAEKKQKAEAVFKKLESALSSVAVARTPTEVVENFLSSFQRGTRITIFDGASRGMLTERLRPFLQKDPTLSIEILTSWQTTERWHEQALKGHLQMLSGDRIFGLQGIDSEGVFQLAQFDPQKKTFTHELRRVPFPRTAQTERSGRWIAETALLWMRGK